MNQKEKIAKVIRIISVPPVMVTTLLLILAGQRGNIFHNVWEFIITLFLLGVVPVLAYPLQKVIPSLADSVREGQRTAFIADSFYRLENHYSLRGIWGTGGMVFPVLKTSHQKGTGGGSDDMRDCFCNFCADVSCLSSVVEQKLKWGKRE